MTRRAQAKIGAKALATALIVTTTLVCAPPTRGWAMLAPARAPAATQTPGYDRAADMKTVQAALESKMVRERLRTLGLSDKEVESRLSRLSDRQVHRLAKDIQTLSPGGDVVLGVLGAVVLVLLIIFLVNRL